MTQVECPAVALPEVGFYPSLITKQSSGVINKRDTMKKEKLETKAPVKQDFKAIIDTCTLNDADFNSALISTCSKAEAVQAEIQTLALSALLDAAKRKDALRVNKLVNTLPDATKKNSLRLWFELFGTVKFDAKSKQFSYDKNRKADVHGAINKPWFKAIPEKEYIPFDGLDKLQAVYHQMVKKLDNLKPEDKLTNEFVNKLGGFIAELKTAA